MFRTASTRLNTLAVALLVALGLALAAGAPGSPIATADASTVQGTVRFYTGYNAGASLLTLQRYNGYGWANVVNGKSNSSGYFAFTLQAGGYSYRVVAARTTGQCFTGGIGVDTWGGISASVYTPSNTVATTNPYLYYVNHVDC